MTGEERLADSPDQQSPIPPDQQLANELHVVLQKKEVSFACIIVSIYTPPQKKKNVTYRNQSL